MIYLIDDNQSNQRVERYRLNYIESGEFNSILRLVVKLEKGIDLSFLKNADCILLHKTTEDVVNGEFLKGSISNAIKIKEEICEEGVRIPLVLFSHDMDEIVDFPNTKYVRSINKGLFYQRLFDFLSYYAENRRAELGIFAYGKYYISAQASEYVSILVSDLQLRNRSEILALTDIKLKVLEDLVKISSIQMSFDELIISLEDEPITIEKYIKNLSLINESFAEYGKNIYGWFQR